MFIRFVVPSKHQDSHCLTGVFHAVCRLCDGGQLNLDEQQGCDDILCWFNRYLPFPDRFSRSRRRYACGKAVCWFKSGASRYIRRVWELAAILDRHDMLVEMLRTPKPGYIVYEDPYQVAAVPFRGIKA